MQEIDNVLLIHHIPIDFTFVVMMRLVPTLLLMLISTGIFAHVYHYKYTTNCAEAYGLYLSLQPEKAGEYIKKEFISDPYNLMATYLADYDDCLLLLFNGNKVDYDQRKHHLNDRIELLERGNENSPWHRLCKAGIYMHWAFVQLRMNDNLKAGLNFRRSFMLLRENDRLFPDFEYDDIFLGIEEAAVGSLPDNYKWIANILGMKGDVNKGSAKVKHFIDTHKYGDPFYNEAVLYYVYISYFLLSDKEQSWRTMQRKGFNTDDNLVHAFVKANVALNYRKADVAEQMLKTASASADYRKYPIFDYEYGYALLHKLDNGAIHKFTSFLKNYTGRLFVKDAWQKLAYVYYLQGDMKNAVYCKNKIRSAGSSITDSDKQAQRFSEQSSWPDAILLKAQLLTDGGYYKQALAMLEDVTEANFTETGLKLEYYFRLARIYDELGREQLAVKYYNQAIELGRYRKEQYAARSALQLGFLYEDLNKYDIAKKMYELALSMEDHDFENSIDQQAKAGIDRLDK